MIRSMSFREHTLVHPNIGIRMHKPKDMRPEVPGEMIRLRSIFLRILDGDRRSPMGSCHVCEKPTLDNSDSIHCLLCDLHFHNRCCARLSKWAKDSVWLDSHVRSADWHADKWPNLMLQTEGSLCSLCELVYEHLASP